MPPFLIEIAIGLFFLYLGAEVLVWSASKIAFKLGISPLVIGIIIIGFGTSTPELFVTLEAIKTNHFELAIGNIIGSNLFNLGVILSLVLIIRRIPIQGSLRQLEMPMIIFSSILFWVFLSFNVKSQIIGIIFLTLLITYLIMALKYAEIGVKSLKDEFSNNSFIIALFLAIGSLFALDQGSNFLIKGSLEVASRFGISESKIGQSLVAIGTSLPELFVIVIALIKKEGELALGNILGSNIFNLLGVFGFAALFSDNQKFSFPHLDYLWMIGLTAILIDAAYRGKETKKIHGFILIAGYFFYCLYLRFS